MLIRADDIHKKRIERTIKYGFDEQYLQNDSSYERFVQAEKDDKNVLDKLIIEFENCFGTIILFSEETIDLDIKRQVIDAVNDDNVVLTIEPFLYKKRRKLISNVLANKGIDKGLIYEKTEEINNLINVQIKYFILDPDFIISFVNQYEADSEYNIHFTAGMNVFTVVYENSFIFFKIKNNRMCSR